MARKPVISRRFTSYTVNAIVVNRETAELKDVSFTFLKPMKAKAIGKEIGKAVGEDYIVVKFSEPVISEVKKAMDLDKFYELAEVIE